MRPGLTWPTWLFAVLASLAIASSCAPPSDATTRARDLERRILAPCCFHQTLEDHESEIARALRAEIEVRTAAGEPSRAIEDDLARRHGDGIRAMPRDWDPRTPIGVGLAVVLSASVLVIVLWLRGRPTDRAAATRERGDPADLDYQDRLDDELVELDG